MIAVRSYPGMIVNTEVLEYHEDYVKCFYISSDPIPTYVFEDLISSGYRLGDHVGGLNEEHSRILIRKIAQFHATTMVLADKK
uniref:Uncharacterized protein n=1 Tax=Megaselia scalaris TaxID=36166 RepID=T1GCL8_MEGSC